MTTRTLFLAVAVLAGCGGGQRPVSTMPPAPAPDAALGEFMRGVADSNLVLMASRWGSSRGSAAETGNPSDYQKRIVIMQAYLRGATWRVLNDVPSPTDRNRRVLEVELRRGGCVNTVPFTMVRTGSGAWLVNQFNLEQVGAPGRACAAADSGR